MGIGNLLFAIFTLCSSCVFSANSQEFLEYNASSYRIVTGYSYSFILLFL